MAKDDVNKIFDAFAWLIYKEMENYVILNEADYQAWAQERIKKERGTDESSREKEESDNE